MNSYLSYLLPLWDRKKFINALRILSSYVLSRLTRRYFVWGKPYTFIIEPTAHCNLRCPRYVKKNGTYQLKSSYSGYCKKIWYGSVITWDKTVIPCCFDKDAEYVLGHLNQTGFEEVWDGENYHRFRKMVVQNRDALEMCRNCTEGLRIFFRK